MHDGVLKRHLLKANARWEIKNTGDAAIYYIGPGPYNVLCSRALRVTTQTNCGSTHPIPHYLAYTPISLFPSPTQPDHRARDTYGYFLA